MIVYPQAQSHQVADLTSIGRCSLRMGSMVNMAQIGVACENSHRLKIALEPTNTNPKSIEALDSWFEQEEYPFTRLADQWVSVMDITQETDFSGTTGILGLSKFEDHDQQRIMNHLCAKGQFHLVGVTPQPWMFSLGIKSCSWIGWDKCSTAKTPTWCGTQTMGARGFTGTPPEPISLFHLWSCLRAWSTASQQATRPREA